MKKIELSKSKAPTLYDSESDQDSCGVGCIAHIRGKRSNEILQIGLTSLANVSHRGAIGADGVTGDGAGVLTDMPVGLLKRWLTELGSSNDENRVAVAALFLPRDKELREESLQVFEAALSRRGLRIIGYRDVPVDVSVIGPIAIDSQPVIVHALIAQPDSQNDIDFQQKLYLCRREIATSAPQSEKSPFYVCSISKQVMVYKGLVRSAALKDFYLDLADPDYECSICVYHQRFSTNTFPSWNLCQPFRMLGHNGEINTIRGNRNWMNARQSMIASPIWGDEVEKLFPLLKHDDSDSASLDNTLEFLTNSGRSILHSMAMMIPPSWHNDSRMPAEVKDFYEYHSCFSEPWDGPAALAFSDGKIAAACLDRNGLRPARFKITSDDIFIVGSEAGCDEVSDERVIRKGQLAPGQMIAVDTQRQRLLSDSDIKLELARQQPYGEWLKQNRTRFNSTDVAQGESEHPDLVARQIAAGLTQEDRDVVIKAMVETGNETTFSMGLDTPLAVLSEKPQIISRYFKQLFAQVTNPPIDSIREKNVMTVGASIGAERNLLDESPEHCRVLTLDHPVLFEHEFDQVKNFNEFPSITIDCTWDRTDAASNLRSALDLVCEQADAAALENTLLILSDRNVNAKRIAIPMLIAVGAIHHRLCTTGRRMRVSLLADTSSAWEPHQFALMFGFGVTAICPYLALKSAMQYEKTAEPILARRRNYRHAIEKGLLKIMAKMGISVLNSYQGAQIFEAIGLSQDVMDVCFSGTRSAIGGIGFDQIEKDYLLLHEKGFQTSQANAENQKLFNEGRYKPRKDGESHLVSGHVTKSLHQFVRAENERGYDEYLAAMQSDKLFAIRDLFEFASPKPSIPLDRVEPIENIRTRFTTAAMSLGAISPEAHEAIAIAMNEIGGKSNSGEGGEDQRRFTPDEQGRSANSKIKQIASGRFGVTAHYLVNAQELEIKMAQGAKPGEGGQLPAFKVNSLIAKLRHTDPGVQLISPPPHHDIYSIEDLSQLIYDLKCVNPDAHVCVKLVAKSGVGNIAAGVAKANADVILISGHEGGTGASPLSSINYAGVPWEIGLRETHQTLAINGLRDRVILRADGGLKTGRDIILAAILGAEEYNFGTMALMALGCVYVRKCHLNTCPVGIATQDPKFRSKFKGEPEHLVRYVNAIAQQCREIMAALGVSSISSLIGRTEFISKRKHEDHSKAQTIDLSRLLEGVGWIPSTKTPKPKIRPGVACFDDQYLNQVARALATGNRLTIESTVHNTSRNIGSRISGQIARNTKGQYPDQTMVQMKLQGSCGQSLGAMLVVSISIDLIGEANDYVGKSMSGGEIVVRPPANLLSQSSNNSIIGSTCLYGATGGHLFAAGLAAERFAIRNSGAVAVIEGCGDHGCEYMTRGTVVVLGSIGLNFAAGMTGGRAFVFDPENTITANVNMELVSVESLNGDEQAILQELIRLHREKTNSPVAHSMLENWDDHRRLFKRVQSESNNDSGSQQKTQGSALADPHYLPDKSVPDKSVPDKSVPDKSVPDKSANKRVEP